MTNTNTISKVEKYESFIGVPEGHYMLMKIDCFGEKGGPHCKDRILFHSESRDSLKKFCVGKYRLGLQREGGNVWIEYFIVKNRLRDIIH